MSNKRLTRSQRTLRRSYAGLLAPDPAEQHRQTETYFERIATMKAQEAEQAQAFLNGLRAQREAEVRAHQEREEQHAALVEAEKQRLLDSARQVEDQLLARSKAQVRSHWFELNPTSTDADFEREWQGSLRTEALDRLRQRQRAASREQFRRDYRFPL